MLTIILFLSLSVAFAADKDTSDVTISQNNHQMEIGVANNYKNNDNNLHNNIHMK